MLADPTRSHLVRPGPHKMLDGRILPPLLSSDEMEAWATRDVEPALWRLMGHKIKASEWSKKRHRKGNAQRLADAVNEMQRKEQEGDAA